MSFLAISPRRLRRVSVASTTALFGDQRLPRRDCSGNSDGAIIKHFVRKLNRGDMDLFDIVSLKTKVFINEIEFDLDEFLDIANQHSTAFPYIELFVMGGAVKGPTLTTVAVAYRDVRTGPEDTQLPPEAHHTAWPEILQFTVDDGKLATVHWKTVEKSANPNGLIRYVKKYCRCL